MQGVQVDKVESHDEEGSKILSSPQEGPGEEFVVLLRQQKYLHNLTEQALKKNKPLIILNLMHEKAPLLLADELAGNEKVEQICLGALTICSFPGHSSIPISNCDDVVEGDSEACPSGSKASIPQVASSAALADSDFHQIVSFTFPYHHFPLLLGIGFSHQPRAYFSCVQEFLDIFPSGIYTSVMLTKYKQGGGIFTTQVPKYCEVPTEKQSAGDSRVY